jgi:hypothetical protein
MLKAVDVIDVLSDPFIMHGVPGHIRSGNEPEFVAKAVRYGSARLGLRRLTLSWAVHGRTCRILRNGFRTFSSRSDTIRICWVSLPSEGRTLKGY